MAAHNGKPPLAIFPPVNGIQFFVKKRSLSRGQNLSCEKRRQVPCISAAAKFRMSAHRANFRAFGVS
jgi:hypothetical protein